MTKRTHILTLLTVRLMSCSTNKKEDMTIRQDKFTWNVQLAGCDHDKADQKGETNYNDFLY